MVASFITVFIPPTHTVDRNVPYSGFETSKVSSTRAHLILYYPLSINIKNPL